MSCLYTADGKVFCPPGVDAVGMSMLYTAPVGRHAVVAVAAEATVKDVKKHVAHRDVDPVPVGVPSFSDVSATWIGDSEWWSAGHSTGPEWETPSYHK